MCFSGRHRALHRPGCQGRRALQRPCPTQPPSSRRWPGRPPAAVEPSPPSFPTPGRCPPPPPPKGARMNPSVTARSLGPPGGGPRAPAEKAGGRPHPAQRLTPRPRGTRSLRPAPASDCSPDPVSEPCPESPITFPKQMWHVMGRVRDSVTFCTV